VLLLLGEGGEVTCVHRWDLEAFKAEALGVCLNCGDERTFKGGIDWSDNFAGKKNVRGSSFKTKEAA